MNIWRLTLFLLLLNMSIYVVGVAQIPIKCNAAQTSCIYFGNDIIGTTTLSDIIMDNVDESNYKAVQVEADVAADIYTATATAISKAGQTIVFSLHSVYSIIIFVLGGGAVSFAIAVMFQSGIYFFYARYLASLIKEGTGEI